MGYFFKKKSLIKIKAIKMRNLLNGILFFEACSTKLYVTNNKIYIFYSFS